MLLDLLGVTLAGSNTREIHDLVQAWEPWEGPAVVIGHGRNTDVDTSALINAASACCLELDEGNKYAGGHPAAHVIFAALGTAQSSAQPISGHQLLAAITVGYEIAARFGAATTLKKGWHPHGHWGATGAASSVALLKNLDRKDIAAAIDTTAGLMQTTPWPLVTEGAFPYLPD
ncbi:MAG: MmgE/PrpD family protein [Micrococcaceae bacterium]|nr:MmgE/PrpD family protein [Micrococcaceae bacterium]